MSQESIWEESLNEKIDNKVSGPVIIKRNFPYELTEMDLRNYFNIYSVNDINAETMYDYFKDNMFKECNGLYLPHMIIETPYIIFNKKIKALDEAFRVISPNIGSNTDENYNYFQYYMLLHYRRSLNALYYKVKELYEVGIKHGLNKYYSDTAGRTNLYYYFAFEDIEEIKDNFEFFLSSVCNSEQQHALNALNNRFYIGDDRRYALRNLVDETSFYSKVKGIETYNLFYQKCNQENENSRAYNIYLSACEYVKKL